MQRMANDPIGCFGSLYCIIYCNIYILYSDFIEINSSLDLIGIWLASYCLCVEFKCLQVTSVFSQHFVHGHGLLASGCTEDASGVAQHSSGGFGEAIFVCCFDVSRAKNGVSIVMGVPFIAGWFSSWKIPSRNG